MKIIAIEEHWNSASIRQALNRLPEGSRDDSVASNDRDDNEARQEDIGPGRIEVMDAAGIDLSILSVVTPATQALPAREAVALARDANDEATDAVRAHPTHLRAFATLPTSDPHAAAAELERCATKLGHVGALVHGRSGTRTLDDPAYTTCSRPRSDCTSHLHPPADPDEPAARRRLPRTGPAGRPRLATFGWGWHMDAGRAALRLILRGTLGRHPDLQLVLGHWGEMLLFWMDRADSVSGVAKNLQRRVSDYIRTNTHITSSGMLHERLLRHTLDFTDADHVLRREAVAETGPMAQVDPDDDGIERFVVHRYAYDPERRQRRHIVVVAFDNPLEFETAINAIAADLRRRRGAGEDVDPGEHIGGTVLEPGHHRKQQGGRMIRHAIEHGVSLDAATWDRLASDLPSGTVVMRFESNSGS